MRSWIRMLVGLCVGVSAVVGLSHESRVAAAGQQALAYEMAPAPMRELIADPTDKFTRVVPFRDPAVKVASLVTINVTYVGFTAEAQAAFQAAVNIWQSQLTSSLPISVVATFKELGPNTLGSAGSNFLYRNFTNAVPDVFYSAALANKLAGMDINPEQHDINANFNTLFTNFYFGTDGNTPEGKFDFISLVLHELGHGLGFSGSMGYEAGMGGYGIGESGNPTIYDQFVLNGAGQSLLNTTLFANPSTALGAQLTSDNLFWTGPQGIAGGNGTRPKMYAPAEWSGGSSFSHLDEATYPAGDVNSLMTPQLGRAEAIQDIGPMMRGIFRDIGWTVAAGCTFTVTPTSASFPVAGGTGTLTVTTSAGCHWTATTTSTFITITAGASGTGSGTVTYTIAANSAAGARSTTLNVAGQTVTVSQSGTTTSTLTLNRTAARYSAVKTGGTLSAQTSAQTFTLNQVGPGAVGWTAVASASWMTVSPASGAGTGVFTVAINNTGNVLPASGSLTGTVTITAPTASNSPQTLTVTLVVYASTTTTSAPTGSWDTPANGAAGIAGALAVTGWAIDDMEVSRVRIYRASFGSEAPGQQIFLGDALSVVGARPDIESANPTVPFNYRAGWGYMLLTNMLPGGGNGTYTLFVYADDREGKTTALGTRTVTIANSTATKPFGAIDAPGAGATISGSAFAHYGWALTPLPKAIPTDGSTVTVFIDGVLVGPITYNQPRGDIATLFPGYANTNGSLGTRTINTTTFSNGVHTISWNVFDNSGAGEGIGSRYFTIQNGSALVADSAAGGPAESLQTASVTSAPLALVRGFDDEAPAETVWADSEGARTIVSHELERLVIRFAPRGRTPAGTYSGHQIVGGELRALPIGSTLDGEDGVFSWAPGPGFLGRYDLVFVRTDSWGARERTHVRVVIGPQHDAPAPR